MQFTFLGTSSGMPSKQRNVTALAISPDTSKRWYLVDCGEATQHQLLHTPFTLNNLEAVLITHVHGDHCYGLPGLLASAATQGRTRPLTIIGPTPLKAYLNAVCEHTYLSLPYELDFFPVERLTRVFALADFNISRVPLSHRVPSYAYRFEEINLSPKLNTEKLIADGIPASSIWNRLQRQEDVVTETGEELKSADYVLPGRLRKFIVSGDNDHPELLSDAAQGIDLLIHEATYTAEVWRQVEPGPQHSSAESIARFAEAAQMPNLILTHFSQRYHRPGGGTIEVIHDEARHFYSGNLWLANDFDVYELNTAGAVTQVEGVQPNSN